MYKLISIPNESIEFASFDVMASVDTVCKEVLVTPFKISPHLGHDLWTTEEHEVYNSKFTLF